LELILHKKKMRLSTAARIAASGLFVELGRRALREMVTTTAVSVIDSEFAAALGINPG
jgi:hypothetical protein